MHTGCDVELDQVGEAFLVDPAVFMKRRHQDRHDAVQRGEGHDVLLGSSE
jgi:hypothetical protein